MSKVQILKVFKTREERDAFVEAKTAKGYKVYTCTRLTVGDEVIRGFIAIY